MGTNYLSIFSSKDEEMVAAIGRSYLSSIISGQDLSKTALILSNKRLYQIGKIYEAVFNSMRVHKGRKIVDIEDITSTTYKKVLSPKPVLIGLLTWIIFWLIPIVAGKDGMSDVLKIVFFAIGFLGALIGSILSLILKDNYFVIEYAGGAIGMPTKFYPEKDLEIFQKKIMTQKDAIKNGFKEYKECPYCAEKILVKAKVCKHCGRDL